MNEQAKINAEDCYETKLLLVRRLLLNYIKPRVFNKEDAEDIVKMF